MENMEVRLGIEKGLATQWYLASLDIIVRLNHVGTLQIEYILGQLAYQYPDFAELLQKAQRRDTDDGGSRMTTPAGKENE